MGIIKWIPWTKDGLVTSLEKCFSKSNADALVQCLTCCFWLPPASADSSRFMGSNWWRCGFLQLQCEAVSLSPQRPFQLCAVTLPRQYGSCRLFSSFLKNINSSLVNEAYQEIDSVSCAMTWPFACRCMFFLHLNRASGFCNCERHPVQPHFRYLSAAGPSPLPHSSTLNNHRNWLIVGVRFVFIGYVIFTEHRLISAEGESERWEARGTEQTNGLVYLLVLIQPPLFPSEQGAKVFRWAFHTAWPSSPDLRLIISSYIFAFLPVPRKSMFSPVSRVCLLIPWIQTSSRGR